MVAWPTTGGSEGTWNDEMETFVRVGHAADGTHDEAGLTAQVVNTSSGAVSTVTNKLIPTDDTIPQNTEGAELTAINTTITPKNASNKLLIEVVIHMAETVNTQYIVALFQDSIADALAVVSDFPSPSFSRPGPTVLRHFMTTGTTSATTFKIRIGTDTNSVVTINGWGTARKFGGILISSMTIMEVWI